MVSEAGVLLIIVRDNRWVEVDWLVVVLVAMVAPVRPRTMDRWSSLSGLRLRSRSSNHSPPCRADQMETQKRGRHRARGSAI